MNEITKEEAFKSIEERKRRFQYNELFKNVILQDMSITKSWLSFEDLEQILSKEKYQELEPKVEKEIDNKIFIISQDEQNDFYIQENITWHKVKSKILLSPLEINTEKLAGVVQKAMKKHLNCGKFDSNEYLTAEEIQKILEYDINLTKTYLKDNEETNNFKENKEDKYLQIRKENIFTKLVNFIKRIFAEKVILEVK